MHNWVVWVDKMRCLCVSNPTTCDLVTYNQCNQANMSLSIVNCCTRHYLACTAHAHVKPPPSVAEIIYILTSDNDWFLILIPMAQQQAAVFVVKWILITMTFQSPQSQSRCRTNINTMIFVLLTLYRLEARRAELSPTTNNDLYQSLLEYLNSSPYPALKLRIACDLF